MIKKKNPTYQPCDIEGNVFNLGKSIYQKFTSIIILSDNQKYSLKSGARQECVLLLLLLDIVLEVSASMEDKKEIKYYYRRSKTIIFQTSLKYLTRLLDTKSICILLH